MDRKWLLNVAVIPLLMSSAACTQSAATQVGTLELRANGEDFIRQGFTSKDGWQIEFDHVYADIQDVVAYQAAPPFNPDTDVEIAAKTNVLLTEAANVDLAEGDATAAPILVEQVETTAGRYNALSWKLISEAGPALVVIGTATRDGETIPFEIALNPSLEFFCGDFVGDERKGILSPEGTANVEATFHFDHLFGDIDISEEEVLNRGALGFDPFAALAQDGVVNLTPEDLEIKLTKVEKLQLADIYKGLGHVGEGHCRAEEI
ncbi:DUF4382 domain-containing protein [Leptothoe spongobia]|uniref:DUF4382 domain-containing protein n=1 Tax=Leptothoe spongobia TAU-MAC 1115 TaxID=1967444 RepID=A0A947DCH8_9CYAN|nr:DUF4382 domain-containing protein [Leptothoe spongobia]MBT9314298.1 DUF4382 domain-containing protein [Leptothoe spongobia TAU-MAC 1115]